MLAASNHIGVAGKEHAQRVHNAGPELMAAFMELKRSHAGLGQESSN